MTTTLTITSGQASFTAQGYTILPSPGTAVPDNLAQTILAAAYTAGVVLSSSAGTGTVIVPSRRFTTSGTGAPSSGSWLLGDEVVDSAGAEWECTAAGSPGTWVAAQTGTFVSVGKPGRTRRELIDFRKQMPGAASVLPKMYGTSTAQPTASPSTRSVTTHADGTVYGVISDGCCLIYGPTAFTITSGNVAATMPNGIAPASVYYEFVTDAPIFSLAGSFNLAGWQVEVDGEVVLSTTAQLPGTPYQAFDWNGVRKFRHYRITTGAGFNLTSIRCGVLDTIYPPANGNGIRMGWMSDSYSQGNFGIPHMVAQYLGWQFPILNTDGGTGYVATGSGGTTAFGARMPDLIAGSYDVLVLAGGLNDPATDPAYTNAVRAVIQQSLAGRPGAPVFVLSPWTPPLSPKSGQGAKWTDMATICASLDSAATPVKFIDTTSPSPWMFGTGHLNAPAGDGNADLYIGGTDGNDVTHPTQDGKNYLAERIAAAIAASMSY